ncbi:MAG: PilN domain-containing protein [Myxococcota bacterium]|jgi:type IV pilus assembly protein PilN
MIRINLIGTKTKRAKGAAAGAKKWELLIFLAVIVAEIVFLFLWQQRLDNELVEAKKRTRDATTKIEDLKRVKIAWENWQREKADIIAQEQVFERLRADQVGPPAMLEYLMYALTPLRDGPGSSDEVRAQELAGWNPKWDTRRVWLKTLKEDAGKLTLQGEAVDHEDVAEFYRRLESSGYFFDVEPGVQDRKVHSELEIKFVDFQVSMGLTYLPALATVDSKPAEAVAATEGEVEQPAAAPEAPPPATPSAPSGGPGTPVDGPGTPVSMATPGAPAVFSVYNGGDAWTVS